MKSIDALRLPDEDEIIVSNETSIEEFRARALMLWIITNAILITIMSSDALYGLKTSLSDTFVSLPQYLKFIFYSIFGMNLVKTLSSIAFLCSLVLCG